MANFPGVFASPTIVAVTRTKFRNADSSKLPELKIQTTLAPALAVFFPGRDPGLNRANIVVALMAGGGSAFFLRPHPNNGCINNDQG